jgi:hypothetical protein
LNPEVQSISWGDLSTTNLTTNCDHNSPPGSSCWLVETCNQQLTACTFTLFAPGHIYAEEGAYSGTFFWRDVSTMANTALSATVDDAPVGNPTGGAITGSQGHAFTNATMATFTDGNPGDHSADMRGTIDWGDGGPTTACGPASSGDPCLINFASGVYSVIAGHTYAKAGGYSPTVTISDRGGSQTQAHATVTVVGPPPPPLGDEIRAISTSGPTATVTIGCEGPTGETCGGTATVTIKERKRGASVVGVTASKLGRPPTKTVVATAATHTFSVAVGQLVTLHMTLNATGKRLLSAFYALPATLALSGPSGPARRFTFAYPRIRSIYTYTIDWTRAFSTVRLFSVTGLPPGAQVTVSCSGGGCRFGRRVLHPHRTHVNLAVLFTGARLEPGAVLELEITAVNHVGEVALLTIESGSGPAQANRCLPPGARSPKKCV